MSQGVLAEVFTADEVARAAGVSPRKVAALIAAGDIPLIAGTPYIAGADAVRVGRRLAMARASTGGAAREMFAAGGIRAVLDRRAGLAAFASSAFHAVIVAAAVWFSAGAADMQAVDETPRQQSRLVFIVAPGPGGGGGGGGVRNPLPAARVRRQGVERRVSVPAVKPPPVLAEPAPDPPPAPEVVAPVVAVAADPRDQEGVIEEEPDAAPSEGSGTNGGAGTGQGTGSGDGLGSGIGEGAGGGTGGGPYRPGSGIEPPRLLREVKAVYTDDARQRGVTGDVLLEIVVGRDGSVGSISVLRGLGAGLDQRAVEAVRQWRFAPARRHAVPVDVIVEVAVEFTLR